MPIRFNSLFLLLFLVGCSQIKKMYSKLPRPAVHKQKGNQEAFFNRIWAKNLDPLYRTGNLPISMMSPTIYDGLIFQGSLSGEFFAYSLENGRLIWKAQERESISSSAAIFDKSVIYGDLSGRMYARHLITGKLIYSFDVNSPIEGKVIFFKQRGFVHTRNHSLVSFDAKTGKVFWSFKRSIPYTTTIQGVSDPLIYQNYLIVGFGDGHLVALSYEDGILMWEKKMFSASKFVDVDISPQLYQKALYVGSYGGKFSKLNPITGDIIQRFDFQASGPPLFTQKKMFVGDLDGNLWVFTEKGHLLKKIPLAQHIPITGALWWKNHLVVSDTNGYLYQIDPVKLVIRSQLHLGHKYSAVYGHLSTTKKYLAVMSARNRLYVFK